MLSKLLKKMLMLNVNQNYLNKYYNNFQYGYTGQNTRLI